MCVHHLLALPAVRTETDQPTAMWLLFYNVVRVCAFQFVVVSSLFFVGKQPLKGIAGIWVGG